MKYLSLFSGIGGGDLAMQHLLEMKCIGYVESNEYCQKVISQRIADGFLDRALIFGDIQLDSTVDFFVSLSYKEDMEASGQLDLITAGFP